ncbi:MAG TPA: adenylate/guanylate cyclase domain-containing protein [Burkholderiales bacterium]|nr:adenylate/guanylate cyclase domain-containing protein [Burkholderiales bacterium]
MNQQIRFCRSYDGARIAYAIAGDGPPLVKAPHWLTHLEHEWESPIWRPWIEAFSRDYTLVRMDQRGCGLSDRNVNDISFDAFVRDLEAVVDAAGLERFALFGHSQGAPYSIEYALRHAERVTHLVLLGGYVRGWLKRGLPPEREAEIQAQLKLIEVGWGREEPSYRHVFSSQFIPDATLEEMRWFSDLQRMSTTPENAVRIVTTVCNIDVRAAAAGLRCPSLVLHARGDVRVPLEEGRIMASEIAGARFVVLETRNHVLLEREPAFRQFFEELRAFLPQRQVAPAAAAAAEPGEFRQRLAAILSADAEGYSRLMAQDERATLAALDAARAVFRREIELNRGRVVDMAGDSVLAVFDTAAGAVTAALGAQKSLGASALRFRIGVHLGDVIEKADGTIYGDGVNIAARLQALASAGGVTVSDAVRGSVKSRVGASFDDQGEQQVKNMPEPIRAYRVRLH